MAASNAFTSTSNKIEPVLSNKIKVKNTFEKSNTKEYLAIWDTGATNSAISLDAAQELNLMPTGMTRIGTAAGITDTYTYVVDVILPSDIVIKKLQVTEAKLNGFDMLIGMDIMNQGDFAISNHNGQTTFTFRIPSIAKTDYVQENRTLRATKKDGNITVARNSKCPCGSGRKYKQCCGVIKNK